MEHLPELVEFAAQGARESGADAAALHDIRLAVSEVCAEIVQHGCAGAVDYLSSAGLRVLLATLKQTRSPGGDLRLVGPHPEVRKVLDLSGFTSILKIFDTVDDAVASFG